MLIADLDLESDVPCNGGSRSFLDLAIILLFSCSNFTLFIHNFNYEDAWG